MLTVGELNARAAREQFAVCGELNGQAAQASPLVLAQALPNGRIGVNGSPTAGQQLAAQAKAMQVQANAALGRYIDAAGRLQGLLQGAGGNSQDTQSDA